MSKYHHICPECHAELTYPQCYKCDYIDKHGMWMLKTTYASDERKRKIININSKYFNKYGRLLEEDIEKHRKECKAVERWYRDFITGWWNKLYPELHFGEEEPNEVVRVRETK